MSSVLKKSLYFEKLTYLFKKYPRILVVRADNVGSNQIQKCRIALKQNSILVMGKNTIIKKVLKQEIETTSSLECLYSYINGNIGLIFTKSDPFEVREILKLNKIPAPAKIGQLAQDDVFIPAGLTEIPPDGTSFFQALNIPTKIQKGLIEILDSIKIIEKGKIISSSEAALLKKLNIVPFSFELTIQQIFDSGICYSPSILDINMEQIKEKFTKTISRLNLIGLKIGYPNIFSIKYCFKKIYSKLILIGSLINLDLKKKIISQSLQNGNKTYFSHQNEEPILIEDEKIETIINENDSEEDFGLGLFE
jgi:large subunit ribosomal protein LP0